MSKALEVLKAQLRALQWDGRMDGHRNPIVCVDLPSITAIDALKEIEALEAGGKPRCDAPKPKDVPVEIKPGPELDQAVVEAIGLKYCVTHPLAVLITSREWDELRGINHPACEGDVACMPFCPSTDLDAAFAAAEEAMLFGDGICLLEHRTDGWRVFDDDRGRELAAAPTPALAICAAILKLGDTETKGER